MKLQYFMQTTQDPDDQRLTLAKLLGIVPERCLLGGQVVERQAVVGFNPCDTCNGPRPRCGGTPQVDPTYGIELKRIRSLLTGDDTPH